MTANRIVKKPIQEHVQAPIRKRLEVLRKSRNLQMKHLSSFSPTTINKYEKTDISSLSLGFAFEFAGQFGLNPKDFFEYLLSGDEVVFIKHETSRNAERILSYMRELPSEDQALLVDITRTMVEHHCNKIENKAIDDTIKRIKTRNSAKNKSKNANAR